MNVKCTNKNCELDKCIHHGEEHEWTPACHGGCLDNGQCARTFSEEYKEELTLLVRSAIAERPTGRQNLKGIVAVKSRQ